MLAATNATSTYNFGLQPTANICGDKMIAPGVWQVDQMATQIGVITPNIMDYPDQGYIYIDDEVIFYTGRSTGGVAGTFPPSSAKFTGLTRANLATVAAAHNMDRPVHLFSVAATSMNGFDTSASIIQIGDEWFGPVQRDPLGKPFWVGFVNAQKPMRFERGYNCCFSIPSSHSAGDKVLPTFLGRDVTFFPSGNRASMGAGDRVTLTDSSNAKVTARIRRTSTDPRPQNIQTDGTSYQVQIGGGGGQIAALWDVVARNWVPDNQFCRILKFPSGELLGLPWLNTASPQVTIGPVAGSIDELKAFAGPKGRLRIAQQQAGTSDTTLYVSPTNITVRDNGGLFKIGDEYIGYANWPDPANQATVSQVKRAWLNSNGELHDLGDPVFYLPWLPVAALSSDVSAEERTIHLKQRMAGDPARYRSGYLLLDHEMLLFQWNGDDGMTLSMPPTLDGRSGLYRGMFGTQSASHSSSNCLAYGMPFRVWDTYKQRQFDNSMVYFQWSTQLDLAHWKSFIWKQTLPQNEKNIVIHGLAKIDGKGEWWDPPGMNDMTLLVESVSGNGNVKLDRTSYQNVAGQFDVRFYVEYKQGSFDAQNMRQSESWKRAPKIQEIQVEYDRPIQTLHHEDR
jgi:hypothetical protein